MFIVCLLYQSEIFNASDNKSFQQTISLLTSLSLSLSVSLLSPLSLSLCQSVSLSFSLSLSLSLKRTHTLFPPSPSFVYLSLNIILHLTGLPVIRNLCGGFKSGQITAIIGPSGAGKTSLLSLLRGQTYYATISGILRVNIDLNKQI